MKIILIESILSTAEVKEILRLYPASDIILLDEAVYSFEQMDKNIAKPMYALQSHVEARGITTSATLLCYNKLIDMIAKSEQLVLW